MNIHVAGVGLSVGLFDWWEEFRSGASIELTLAEPLVADDMT